MQSSAQAGAGTNCLNVELARPRIIPHPVAATIEFDGVQIVAKMSGLNREMN
jgi:hypothetical protein